MTIAVVSVRILYWLLRLEGVTAAIGQMPETSKSSRSFFVLNATFAWI